MALDSVPDSEIFRSILWPGAHADAAHDDVAVPDCFHDLNLDQAVDAITAAWSDENLAPFFRTSLRDPDAIAYRQEILRDLEQTSLRQAIEVFTQDLRAMRAQLAGIDKLHNLHEKERAFLGAADVYQSAVQTLARSLQNLLPASRGLRGLHAYLADCTTSTAFEKLATDTSELLSALDAIRYGLILRSDGVTVRGYEDEVDASVEVEEIFAKFRREGTQDYRAHHHGRIGVNGLNHIEAQLLDRIVLLNPQVFADLDAFCAEHEHFVDATVARCAREVCFYLAWLAYIAPMQAAGLPFCFPCIGTQSKTVECTDAFDLALAAGLQKQQQSVVRNDFALRGVERILVVSGPNHGGKTTFARMFGQLHWLAALGCTVPGTSARLFLFDRLFTHFEKEERIDTLRGKLKDDLFRIHRILEQATADSLIILNEIFASTTLDDALDLSRNVMARIARLDALVVCVTFLTELASFNEKTVSMVSAVDPHDPAVRTYKLERRAADGLAYALAIAGKYRVTRDCLLRRIAP